jgi:tetratricopeptide (TPR) repeat protein
MRSAKITAILILAIGFMIRCNNNKEPHSPYDEILHQPPYSSLTDSIKREPSNNELYFRRAVLLNKNDLPEPALADFKKAWSLQKDEKYALGISTILLDRKPDSAILFLHDAIKAVPNSFLLQLSLARAFDSQDKTDKALDICNAILQNNPQQVDALKMKSALLEKKGNMQESIHILETAYTIAPYDADLNYDLAFKYAETKNAKVVALCDSLIQKDSMHIHAEPYYYKGIYYSNINDKATALTLFQLAIQHDYYYLNAYIEKGRVLYDERKYADAIKVFQLANTISAKFPDAYYWTGKCQEALGQKDEALLNYQRAYGLDAGFEEAKEAALRIQK